ncbi:MBL fold metallo-hydrolase [bacterium RCC_150]
MQRWETQPEDWTEPGAYRIVEGVYRIPLPLPLKGLQSVNAYLLVDGDDAILVDPGFASVESESQLGAAMDSLGVGFRDVGRILSTHTHWDHYSQAIVLRSKYGIPMGVGIEERHTIAVLDAGADFYPAQAHRLFTCGAALLAQQIQSLPREEHEINVPSGVPDVWLEDGQRIPLGGREITIHATPGHTRGHIVIMDPQRGVQITGDHILPRITPSLGLEAAPEAFPLQSFLRSLEMVRQLPDAVMLPAHGQVVASVHERVDALLEHHRERLAAVEGEVSAGAATALDVANNLRWTRQRYTLSELPPVHQMTAILEVATHLDVLKAEGRVRQETIDKVEHFAGL